MKPVLNIFLISKSGCVKLQKAFDQHISTLNESTNYQKSPRVQTNLFCAASSSPDRTHHRVSMDAEQRRSQSSAPAGLSQQYTTLSCCTRAVDKHCFKMAERSQRCEQATGDPPTPLMCSFPQIIAVNGRTTTAQTYHSHPFMLFVVCIFPVY